MGIEVYKDTMSRLHGYGNALLVVRSPAWIHLMSSRLFSRCAEMFCNIGLRALESSHEMRWVGPFRTTCVYVFCCITQNSVPLLFGDTHCLP